MTSKPDAASSAELEGVASGVSGRRGVGDRIFAATVVGAGLLILVVLAAIFVFLAIQGAPGMHAQAGLYAPVHNFMAYAGELLYGTAMVAVTAMIMSVPLSVGVAIYISHYAPRRLATSIAFVIDLLAAVPSVIFGLWGLQVLAPATKPIQYWLNDHLGWIPIFGGTASATGKTAFLAAAVLALMVLPITTAICREVFAQTPRLHEEAALALGATKWEMIRYAVFPHARSGVIAGVMLGLGRALGETMAVLLVLNAQGPKLTYHLLTTDNPATIASNIAQGFHGENIDTQKVLLATGLVLFVFTFVVNFSARWIVGRAERKFS